MKIEIGMKVRFIALNSNYEGVVINIVDNVVYIAVLGCSGTFPVPIGSILPVV